MKKDDLELVRGSGNVYRDFGRPNAGLEQARAVTAAEIIRIIDERKLSTRDAEKLTGVSYSEFSRIRNTQLGRFTLDRMIAILGNERMCFSHAVGGHFLSPPLAASDLSIMVCGKPNSVQGRNPAEM